MVGQEPCPGERFEQLSSKFAQLSSLFPQTPSSCPTTRRSLTVMAHSMLRLGIRCKVPKATLWARSALLDHRWTEEELLHGKEEDAPMVSDAVFVYLPL